MKKQICYRCHFYLEGACHRRAPSALLVDDSKGPTVRVVESDWPMVSMYQWCGEFKWRSFFARFIGGPTSRSQRTEEDRFRLWESVRTKWRRTKLPLPF